jgi:hypothetical protein
MLSSEISSILTGRSININLFPFSFEEYLNYKKIVIKDINLDKNLQNKIKRYFNEFLLNGGMPKMILNNEKIILRELYENIIYRDIIRRFNPNLTKPIKEISTYLLSNVSSDISLRTLSKVSGIKNLGVLGEILSSFEKAFLFFTINKFDYSIKKQIQNPRKIYSIDLGFPNNLGFKFSENEGNLLENFVAISLKQKNKEFYYFRDKKECDFLVKEKNKIIQAIQVTKELNEKNRSKEIDGLLEAMNKFNLRKGLILTLDEEDELNIDKKINIIPIWKWYLTK